jgi:predicted nuclease of predicted toxin-antitoxin system
VRILANENFPGEAVEVLRSSGHDVVWVRTDAPGSKDRAILEWGEAEKRLLLTFDKDFGELAYRLHMPASGGVILFRISISSPAKVAQKVRAVLESRTDWVGYFSVVEDTRIRMKPLPVR